MSLQNRVDPCGALHAVPARGLFTGNRGIIHDAETRTIVKRWTTKAWIICALQYKNRRRVPMSAGRWTELFFLDEVTALAAGHRPCFTCRREAAKSYLACAGFDRAPKADEHLHRQRSATGKPTASPVDLPDGAMFQAGGTAYAIKRGQALSWSFGGYGAPEPLSNFGGDITVLTPETSLVALRTGFEPHWHASALS